MRPFQPFHNSTYTKSTVLALGQREPETYFDWRSPLCCPCEDDDEIIENGESNQVHCSCRWCSQDVLKGLSTKTGLLASASKQCV